MDGFEGNGKGKRKIKGKAIRTSRILYMDIEEGESNEILVIHRSSYINFISTDFQKHSEKKIYICIYFIYVDRYKLFMTSVF